MEGEENQTEEMVKELAKDMGIAFQLANTTRFGVIAESLIRWHWVKLNKDSIVISKGEYERLKRAEAEKDRLYEIKLDLENQLIEKGWADYEGADEIEKRVNKETVEKFLIKVKQLVEKWLSKDDEKVGFIFDFDEFIKEQFVVEAKGNSQ